MGTLVRKTIPGREKIAEEENEKRTFQEQPGTNTRQEEDHQSRIGGSFMVFSVAAGAAGLPEGTEIPVVTAEGDVITPPWYITVEGRKVAIVESEESARDTMKSIVKKYGKSENTVLDIEILEETGAEKMDIETGDPAPEILTASEAEKAITEGNGGESYITVVTTEEAVEEEPIAFEEEYRAEPSMYVGETKVAKEGKEGLREVTKKVVKENGREIREEILEEEIKQEAVDEIILTGTKGARRVRRRLGQAGCREFV